MSVTDPTNHQPWPLSEFCLTVTVAARPMQDGTIDVRVGSRQWTTQTTAEAQGLVVAAVNELFAS